CSAHYRSLHSFPTRRSSDLGSRCGAKGGANLEMRGCCGCDAECADSADGIAGSVGGRQGLAAKGLQGRAESADAGRQTAVDRQRSEEHTSELQSPYDLVCRL